MTPPPETRKRLVHRSEPVIQFVVAGGTFAIAATAVEEIRNVEGLQPLATSVMSPAKLAKARYRLQRSGKVYCVIDATYHFHLLPSQATRILVLRHHAVAVLVGRIDLMAEISAIYVLPRAFTGEERQWYRGVALIPNGPGEQRLVPVVNPDGFLTKAETILVAPLLQAVGAAP
jgi:chemotaxis signal transduction protein